MLLGVPCFITLKVPSFTSIPIPAIVHAFTYDIIKSIIYAIHVLDNKQLLWILWIPCCRNNTVLI